MKNYCYNCGKSGHNYYNCHLPIMSYGMILYKLVEGEPHFCLIQRSYSPEFKELIKGKFEFDQLDYLTHLVSKITLQEVNYIYQYSHKTLYQNIQKFYKIKRNRHYYHRYKLAKDKYKKLIRGTTNNQGQYIRFHHLVQQIDKLNQDKSLTAEKNESQLFIRDLEPEWGLPKGRRNFRTNESDLDCAIREVSEETGVTPESYEIKPNFCLTETYYGTNHVQYSHKYYLAKCINSVVTYIDPFNRNQVGEIRKIGWYPLKEALDLIRPYHIEKKRLLEQINDILIQELDRQIQAHQQVDSDKDVNLTQIQPSLPDGQKTWAETVDQS